MAPMNHLNKVLEYHDKWHKILDAVFAQEENFRELDLIDYKNDSEVVVWLHEIEGVHGRNSALHRHYQTYHHNLDKIVNLYKKNSHQQARNIFERELKEQSLKLKAELLKYISCLNQKELERYETL